MSQDVYGDTKLNGDQQYPYSFDFCSVSRDVKNYSEIERSSSNITQHSKATINAKSNEREVCPQYSVLDMHNRCDAINFSEVPSGNHYDTTCFDTSIMHSNVGDSSLEAATYSPLNVSADKIVYNTIDHSRNAGQKKKLATFAPDFESSPYSHIFNSEEPVRYSELTSHKKAKKKPPVQNPIISSKSTYSHIQQSKRHN